MKGIILHGGSGTRLRPLTYTDVKQLLPLAGRPVSEYALMNLIELGIKDVNIVLGEIGANEVKSYYGDGGKWGVNISYTYQGKPLGIAHAIGLTKSFVNGDDFVVVLGDNYFQSGFNDIAEKFMNGDNEAFLALTEVSNPGQFGVAEISNGRIVKLVEKPKSPASNLAITGVYFLRRGIFPVIESLSPSSRGELEITEAFQKMIDSGMKVGYSIIKGWWKDTGTPEEFLKCNMMALEKITSEITNQHNNGKYWRAYIEDKVQVDENSEVVGPCFIGKGARIINSYIGPYTSIGRNCKIENCHIENSVVMDNVSINLDSATMINQSLIGPYSAVETKEHDRKFLRFIIGRDSRIEV
ncbi:MAG: glucose-1-phosphate thymidylyltransferase [Candidatus Micrarchaeaceae archaeon]